MPESPTYRVTGDDWDPRELDAASPLAPPHADAIEAIAADEAIAVDPGLVTGEASSSAPGEAAESAERADPDATAGTLDSPPPVIRQMPAVPPALERLEPVMEWLWPHLGRVPPRVLVASAGAVVVIGIAVVAALGSGGPPASVANPTPNPTPAVAAPTPTCPALAELPSPMLAVESAGKEVGRLAGFPPSDPRVNLDGPWPTELGPVEATVLLGSSFRLTAGEACIREWRAVAVRPPAKMGATWRPKRADRLQLGWQKADRIGWQPAVSLPPRGEWVLRITVWYRVPPEPSPEPSGEASATPGGELVVERYFRFVVEAPTS